jgi:acyl-CoA synthetase (AMP-forming)/AMP-acid ligase II
MLGLIRAGALPAAVNWRLAAPEVAALLRLAGPAAVLADADCAALARQAAAGLDRPKLVPLTHQQLITAVVFMKLEVPEAVPGARHLSALPLFHVAGLANLSYTPFWTGRDRQVS